VAAIALNTFEALTFDCYGTLVDWESGILSALEPLREASGRSTRDDQILERFAAAESELEAGEYRPYRDILREVTAELVRYLDVSLDPSMAEVLADSMESWRPFPDTVGALRELGRRYRLAIVSNVDDDLFAFSAKQLEVAFDCVVTSERVKSYKPSHRNFEAVIDRIGIAKEKILHVAQSLYHDIEPANALGMSTVWVNRRKGRTGIGATHPADATPTLEVPDLATLSRLVERAFSS
jgi:2-haloacid dehalogenase